VTCLHTVSPGHTRWFKYDRDDLCVNKSQFVPVILEPPCIFYEKLGIKFSYITLGCDLYTRATYTHINVAQLQTVNKKCKQSVHTRNIKSCQSGQCGRAEMFWFSTEC
jgi:hypothetical protein